MPVNEINWKRVRAAAGVLAAARWIVSAERLPCEHMIDMDQEHPCDLDGFPEELCTPCRAAYHAAAAAEAMAEAVANAERRVARESSL